MTTDTYTETSETLRARAAELRQAAEQARAERETVLTDAQAEADRLIADARQKAGELWKAASEADRAAAKVEERLSYIARREQLDELIPAAEQNALALADEGDRLREQTHALDHRLGELAAERQETSTALAAASNTGDVDQTVETRTRLAALDDVTAALTRQRDGLMARLQAIGEPDGHGEVASALGKYQRLQAEQRRILNALDPSRPEAEADRLTEEFRLVLNANAQRIREEQAAVNNTRTNVVRTH